MDERSWGSAVSRLLVILLLGKTGVRSGARPGVYWIVSLARWVLRYGGVDVWFAKSRLCVCVIKFPVVAQSLYEIWKVHCKRV